MISPDSRTGGKRRLLALTLSVLSLTMSGCQIDAAHGAPSMNSYSALRAQDYFVGRKLKIAQAMDAGDMAQVRQLAQGEDVAAPADKGMTLMLYAMQPAKPNYEAVKTLVALGVDPDTQIAPGLGNALNIALAPRTAPKDPYSLRMLQAMLDGGMSPNKSTKYGNTLLHRAAGPDSGQLELVKLLLARGADIDARNNIGSTALDSAVNTLSPNIAIFLVQKGASVKTHYSNGSSTAWAVHLSIEDQRPGPLRTQFEQLRDLMIAKGAKWPPDPPEVVREQMRAKGLTPAVPPGHKR